MAVPPRQESIVVDAPVDDDALDELADPLADPPPTFETAVAQKVPRWLREELGWVEPYRPEPRAVWWEQRSWRWWCWCVVYVVAGVVDLLLIIAGASGR